MYGDNFTVTTSSDVDFFVAIMIMLIPLVLLIITIIGIWNIHKSIDKLAAIQAKQIEILEDMYIHSVEKDRRRSQENTINNPGHNS